ncbi:MAG: hypothetical protein LQ341_004293 [Variospora aurantia]|nr:MAG: hypothetical protein LQ341_004293 [Variospora aurantia]
MLLGKLLISVLLAAPISARYLTTTAGSSHITSTHCKTFVGQSSKSSVPTHSFLRTARPEVVVVLSASTPCSTVTPPALTATDTVQTYTTTTITASTATGTFSTTTTLFETESITATDTVVSITTSTSTSISTAVVTVPAPSGWITVKNSTGLKDVNDPAVLQGSDVQQPLQDDRSGVRGHWPPGIPRRPGSPRPRNPWAHEHPESVTCFKTVWTRYIKMIIFVKHYTTTTTIPPATSTTTSTQTVSSTSTIVPDAVTSIESFSTTSTTTTTLTAVVTEISSATELVPVTTTTTSYAACFTENVLGNKLQDGSAIYGLSVLDRESTRDIQDTITTAYDCCVSCLLSSDNCQYSTLFNRGETRVCGRLLNPAICHGQDYDSGIISTEDPDNPSGYNQEASNGPCGRLNRRYSNPPGLIEL